MDTKKLGSLGEKIAINFLKKRGYEILDKNYSPKFVSGPLRGEIDVIAKKDGVIVFIEVKTLVQIGRGRTSAISPEEKVDYSKQKKLIKMAESWLSERKISLDTPWQIDVVSIRIDSDAKKAKIRHFQNAIS
jgi:putative endonuclease